MFGAVKTIKKNVRNTTVYLELYGENKTAYRVTAGKLSGFGEEIDTYGIEAEDHITGETERISDFSSDIEDAVAFAELLIDQKVSPRNLYGKALGFLSFAI